MGIFLDNQIVHFDAGCEVGPFNHGAWLDIPMSRWETEFFCIFCNIVSKETQVEKKTFHVAYRPTSFQSFFFTLKNLTLEFNIIEDGKCQNQSERMSGP